MKAIRDRRLMPQETLQETRDLPYPDRFKCPEEHSGPFRPIQINEGGIWLQCRYLNPESKPGVGYCDCRFLIQENELLIVLVSPEVYDELDKRFPEFFTPEGAIVADYLRN